MEVSVIIVNYNTLNLSKNTIDSVFKNTKNINCEIILIDNGSNDKSQEFFKKNYKNRIKIIENKENIGFGKANNIGMKEAKGKYIFLLNPDTVLINNAIKILYDYMEKNEEVGICGGNLFYEDLEPAHSFGRQLPSILTEIRDMFFISTIKRKVFKKREDFNYGTSPIEVGYITGADMMIRKSVLEESGYFDKDFFMYYEETELTNRIKKLGYKVMSVPKAKIIHLEGKSFTFKEHRSKMMYESRYKYFSKVYGVNSIHKSYLILNLNLFLRYLITFNNKYLKMLKINNEEYLKFKKV